MRREIRVALCFLLLLGGRAASAQTPATAPPGPANVEVDPIRCWWRTSAGAVRIGETFNLTLTCAVLENESVQVVPDESRLGSAVIQMAPFEIVTGSHPADLRSGLRRFFQYLYTLRIINPDAIGKDVKIPDLAIHYRVNSRVAENASLQGRDLTYFLPPQWVKVASMVPADTADIRDAGGESFATAEALVFRAGAMEIVAVTLIGLGTLMVLIVLFQLVRTLRRPAAAGQRVLSTSAVLKAALQQLHAVQRDREAQGWSMPLVDRTLSTARVVAACAMGRPVSQRTAGSKAVGGAGRLVAPGGRRGRGRALSSPITVEDLSREIARPRETPQPERERLLEELRDIVSTLSATQYSRTGSKDDSALDGALANLIAAANQLKSEHAWFRTVFRRPAAEEGAVESEA
jgi:hypothetical protein